MSYGVFIASMIVAGMSGLCWIAYQAFSSGPTKSSDEGVGQIIGSIMYLLGFIGLGATAVVLLVVSGVMKLLGH